MRVLSALCAVVLLPDLAFAHEGHVHRGASDAWTWDARIILPLALLAGLYAIGVSRLWARAGAGRGIRFWQAASFLFGWLLLAGALVSPLHWLGERLFTAHMIEHEVIMVLAAPLLVIARPLGAVLWALPRKSRSAWGAFRRQAAVRYLWRRLTGALAATVLHGLAIWVWHVPDFYAAALVDDRVHWTQHLSFLLSALLFWSAIFRGQGRGPAYGVSIFCVLGTALHTALLGVLITLARTPLYPTQTEAAPNWGLSPLEDQQLAGLIMWVPGGALYTAAALALAGLWITRSASRPPAGPVRADPVW